MKRVDADGHDNNLYSNGDPQQAIAPTLLRAEEMNAIQEEICNVIEGFGIALNPADDEQFKTLLLNGIGRNYSTTILNNQAVAVNLTDFILDKTKEVGAVIDFRIARESDTTRSYSIGTIKALYRDFTDDWVIFIDENYDDSNIDLGLVFTILASGQIQYTSTNWSGSSYVGTFKGRIRKILI
jgi:hypothetical protein